MKELKVTSTIHDTVLPNINGHYHTILSNSSDKIDIDNNHIDITPEIVNHSTLTLVDTLIKPGIEAIIEEAIKSINSAKDTSFLSYSICTQDVCELEYCNPYLGLIDMIHLKEKLIEAGYVVCLFSNKISNTGIVGYKSVSYHLIIAIPNLKQLRG